MKWNKTNPNTIKHPNDVNNPDLGPLNPVTLPCTLIPHQYNHQITRKNIYIYTTSISFGNTNIDSKNY